MAAPPPIPAPEILWRQYQLHIELYEHYLDLTLKFNVFYYAVTGAILSFYVTNKSGSIGLSRQYLLLFPILMSLGFAVFFFYGASLVGTARQEVANIAAALGLQVFPEMRVLAFTLRLTAVLLVAIAVGLLVLFTSGLSRHCNCLDDPYRMAVLYAIFAKCA